MFTHPHIASQIAHERQREILAQASQQRLARQPATSPAPPGTPTGLARRSPACSGASAPPRSPPEPHRGCPQPAKLKEPS